VLDGFAAWLPGMLQSDETTRLANLREVSTLCQVCVTSPGMCWNAAIRPALHSGHLLFLCCGNYQSC
jgi:hypothetical protein